MIERKRLEPHLSPSRLSRIAGQPVKAGILVRFVFRTTTSSVTSRAPADFDAREAAALTLIHPKTLIGAW